MPSDACRHWLMRSMLSGVLLAAFGYVYSCAIFANNVATGDADQWMPTEEPLETPYLPNRSEVPLGEEERAPQEESRSVVGVVRSETRRIQLRQAFFGKLAAGAAAELRRRHGPTGCLELPSHSEHALRFGLGTPLRI